jgi:hypothetical protein
MTLFYRGVAPGTLHHSSDLCSVGLSPRNSGGARSPSAIIEHIRRGPAATKSAYISLTRSYGVAVNYARMARHSPAIAPGHVYVIDISGPLPGGGQLVDPVCEIASANSNVLALHSYQHDGDKNFLLGIVDPDTMGHHLLTPVTEPPGSANIPRPARMSDDLEALVRALRDSEVLVAGGPAALALRS